MKFQTTRFGEIDVDESTILTFPDGLPGFQSRRFVRLPSRENDRIEWLQSLDEPEIAVLTTDPRNVLREYRAEPKPAELHSILPDPAASDSIAVRIIVRSGTGDHELSLNLFAPVFLNLTRNLGMQVPLVGSGYKVHEAWPAKAAASE